MEASAITEVLAGRSEEELREMLARVGRSKGCLEEALVDAEAEQKELQDEKEHLLSTIDFMMKELRKLNISSSNLVEPRLEGEGPVEYVARLWETMRPRELSGPVSENMGGEIEIGKAEKPVLPLSFEESPAAQRLRQQLTEGWSTIQAATKDLIPPGQEGMTPKELGKQVAEKGQELKKQISGFFQEGQDGEEEGPSSTPRMVRETLAKQKKNLGKKVEKLAGALSFFTAEDNPGMGQLFSYLRDPTQRPQTGPDSAGPGEPEEEAGKPAEPASGSTSAGSSEGKAAAVSREPSDDHAAAAAAPVEAAASATAPAPVVEAPAPAPAPVVEAPAPVVEEAKEEEEEAPPADEESTLLISVQLTLGDGSVQVCEVRAADRCKEVASRFVKEHSLKNWFEAPLKKYLMEQEANAETFPVKLEADLMEIREQYKKK